MDPKTRKQINSGANVVLRTPFSPEIREFVLVLYDGARLVDKNGKLIIDPVAGILGGVSEDEIADLVDTYDTGSRGFNYRTERLINRLRKLPILKELFDSERHGDPSTPLFEAYRGDPITVRLVNPSERRRSHTFHLHGHYWNSDDQDIFSLVKAVEGEIVAGHATDLRLHYGAGGYYHYPGDYLYRAGNIRWDIEQGMWGILRVHQGRKPHLLPLKNKRKKR